MNLYLDTIIELQNATTQLKGAEQRLSGVPDWMRELHEEHSGRRAEIEGLEQAAETAAKERRTAEAVTQDAQEKLKKYQQQINRVTNQREYGALLQEIDTVKTQIATSESQALSALEQHEKADKELAEKRESFRELDERYSGELARWEAEKPEVARQIAGLKERIATLRSGLPRQVASVFDRVLDRNPSGALAPVRPIERPPGKTQREWACSACNYRVRPQSVVEIRNSDNLVQCDSCKRILYLEPEPQTVP
ncbi:MAG TPA: C4-type zinc ribbon domain-containing protein [Thermoanaerobaculia bacterium]|nr:C4-type zinc ribbon domain-containing protein [Thermoanaerobaculia bacterium]